MKKIGILNNELSLVISEMGHMDMLAIGDCGLPIPSNTKRIDLALIKNIPSFIDTLDAIQLELQFEEVIIATETKEISPDLFKEIETLISNVKVTFVSHEDFKKLLGDCKAVVRTGEQTPYANIILKSGVVF